MRIYKRHQTIKHYNVGKNNPNYIDGRKNEKYFCLDCRIEISNYQHKRCRSCARKFRSKKFKEPMLGKKHSKETREKMSQIVKKRYENPKNNPNWQGGKSFEPYPLGWNKTFKEQIRYRDGYKC